MLSELLTLPQKNKFGLLPRSYVRDLDASELAALTPQQRPSALAQQMHQTFNELKDLDAVLAEALSDQV